MNRRFGATLVFIGAGVLLLAARMRRGGADREDDWEEEADAVSMASDDSFPASDPPSFTPLGGSQTGVAGGIR